MAPYQFIERPSPFNTSAGKTLPIFAVTPAHIETGTIDPIALDAAAITPIPGGVRGIIPG